MKGVFRMTAKRWEIIDEEFISYTGGTAQLISNGECKIHLWENPKDAQLFCDKLNAINKENEQLIQTVSDWSGSYDELFEDVKRLEEENEQLKQFKEKVFTLIDEKIKHYEHKPFSVPVEQPMSVNFDADVDRLARLSELQDLEKELEE
jgi:hypothetical protein